MAKAKEAASGGFWARYYHWEKKVGVAIDELVENMGFRHAPWYRLTVWLLVIYAFLTMMVMFVRPDLINLSICTAGIFFIFETHKVNRRTFRILVLCIFLNFFVDSGWLIFLGKRYWYGNRISEVETGIRRTSVVCTGLSLFLRFFLLLVLWKDCIDFEEIVRYRSARQPLSSKDAAAVGFGSGRKYEDDEWK